eukprot:264019-Pyramimonas_sp.AAC.1
MKIPTSLRCYRYVTMVTCGTPSFMVRRDSSSCSARPSFAGAGEPHAPSVQWIQCYSVVQYSAARGRRPL